MLSCVILYDRLRCLQIILLVRWVMQLKLIYKDCAHFMFELLLLFFELAISNNSMKQWTILTFLAIVYQLKAQIGLHKKNRSWHHYRSTSISHWASKLSLTFFEYKAAWFKKVKSCHQTILLYWIARTPAFMLFIMCLRMIYLGYKRYPCGIPDAQTSWHSCISVETVTSVFIYFCSGSKVIVRCIMKRFHLAQATLTGNLRFFS